MRKSFAWGLALLGLALVVSGLGRAAAAAETGAVSVTFTILSRQMLTVTPTSIAFGDVVPELPTPATNVQVAVKSNVPYNLGYTATNFTGDGSDPVPVGRLTYNGTPFSTSGNLESDHDRTRGLGDTYNYNYVLTVTWDDAAGSYSGTVTYVLSPSMSPSN